MKRLIFLSLPLIACTGGERASSGQCPAGEVCSPLTPNGLHFIGDSAVDSVFGSAFGPAATAIGGTQDIALQYDRGDGVLIALDLDFAADADAANGVSIKSTHGSVVTLQGVGSRQNYLRVVDPDTSQLYDRKLLAGASLESIALLATTFENVPSGAQLAFAAGDVKIGVGLFGQVQEGNTPTTERLVDDSMTIDHAGGTQTAWDTLHVPNATTGTSTISITAGDKPSANVDLVVVDHADAVTPIGTPPSIPPAGNAQFCFQAKSAERFIVGLNWTYTVDGQTVTTTAGQLERNCISVSTTHTTGTIAIVATAGGQSATVTATIAAHATHMVLPHSPSFPTGTTAGDRATLSL